MRDIREEEKWLSRYIDELEDLDYEMLEEIDAEDEKTKAESNYTKYIRKEAARRVRSGWELRTDNRKPAGQSPLKPKTTVPKLPKVNGPNKPKSIHGDPPYEAPLGKSWMFVDETKPKK
ncbi:MAG TPA: hypothetical protein VK914_05790 [bacterium]|jgi:hypothetical protein|nr:hypothetical protein [bacterium]